MKTSGSARASRRSTPRSGTAKSRKSNVLGLDIMERDLKREKSKNEELKLELERVKRENARLHKKREDAINVGVFDTENTDSKLIQMENLYRKKSRALQKSIEKYREEVKQLQAASTKSARSKQIQGLKSRLRDCELKVDVLKEQLANTKEFERNDDGGLRTVEERGMAVNEKLIKLTIGGPKRFRPKTREELVQELKTSDVRNKQEIKRLKEKVKKITEKLKIEKAKTKSYGINGNNENTMNGTNSVVNEDNTEYSATGSPIKDKEIINNLNEIASLKDKVAIYNRKLTEQRHAQEALSNENKKLKHYKEEAKRLADVNEHHKNEIEELQQELTKVMSDNAKLNAGIESSQSSISRLQQMKDSSLNETHLLLRKHNTELRAKDDQIDNLKERIKIMERKEKEKAKVSKENEDTKNTKLAIEKKRHEDLLQSYREKEGEHSQVQSKAQKLEDQVNTFKEKLNALQIDNKTKEEKIKGLNLQLTEMTETRALLKEQINKLHLDHKDERDRQHSSVQDNVGRLQSEKDKADDQIKDLLAKYHEKADKLEDIKAELMKAHATIEKLENAHDAIKSNSDSSTVQLNEQLNSKNKEIEDLTSKIEQLTGEKKELQFKLNELITKNKQMKGEFTQILSAQKITIRDLRKKLDL